MPVWIAAAAILFANVPFGYWRGNVRKFSLQWALAIHVPVALAIALRLGAHLPLEPATLAATVAAFFLGQSIGQRVRDPLSSVLGISPSGCLFCDLARAFMG